MRFYFFKTCSSPHPEERLKGASRRTRAVHGFVSSLTPRCDHSAGADLLKTLFGGGGGFQAPQRLVEIGENIVDMFDAD